MKKIVLVALMALCGASLVFADDPKCVEDCYEKYKQNPKEYTECLVDNCKSGQTKTQIFTDISGKSVSTSK